MIKLKTNALKYKNSDGSMVGIGAIEGKQVVSGMTASQITALDNMFKACAYALPVDSVYEAFCIAFGINGGGTEENPETPETPNEESVHFADYSAWPKFGSGISVIDNGFSIDSPSPSYSAGIAVGILQGGKYGDYKDKTLKFSCDIDGEISAGAEIPFCLRTYTDIPEESYNDNSVTHMWVDYKTTATHVEWVGIPSTLKWEEGTPNDTDYLAVQFYGLFEGTITITNFSIEVI